jgi:hypothetical protein
MAFVKLLMLQTQLALPYHGFKACLHDVDLSPCTSAFSSGKSEAATKCQSCPFKPHSLALVERQDFLAPL